VPSLTVVLLRLLLLSAPQPDAPDTREYPLGDRCIGGSQVSALACIIPVATPSTWKFNRTQGDKAGESFAAIMKTADIAQSDLDFAGLIVRCGPRGKIDVLVALIRPFPPRSRPQVTIASGSVSQTFEASLTAAGAAVVLPDEVAAFAAGKWQSTPALTVTVKENDNQIKGVVELNGLREAYNSLLIGCSQ
jgi:hypothetical protein